MRTEDTTPDELGNLLTELSWNNRVLADRLDCDETQIRRWRAGKSMAPPALLEWLRMLAEMLEDLPPPPEWRQRNGLERRQPRKPAVPRRASQ